jgi:hypothetical protein
MKFQIKWASLISPPKGGWPEIEIATLEELEELDSVNGKHSLVVEFDLKIPTITIYDDYLE